MPTLYIIAGPNGAGKTTAAYSLLPDIFTTVEFVNADEIAKGLSPLNPEGVAFEAGRIMLRRLGQLINDKKALLLKQLYPALFISNSSERQNTQDLMLSSFLCT